MSSALMKLLGEVGGLKWYWAEPGSFLVPGVYYWDGKENVHVSGNTRAPIAEGGGGVLPVLRDVLALLKNTKELQGREHVSLGIRFNAAIESLSRQGATRASEAGDSFDKYDMHVTDDGAVVFTHNGKTAAIYNPIAAAPAPGGE